MKITTLHARFPAWALGSPAVSQAKLPLKVYTSENWRRLVARRARGADEMLQGRFIDLVAFVDAAGAFLVSLI